MGYNINDIIDKTINIEIKMQKSIVEAINNDSRNVVMLNVLGKVFINESNKRIDYYKTLKNVNEVELEEIEYMTYDKISFLFFEYSNKNLQGDVKTPKDYLEFVKNLALEKYSLLVDVQGRLINNMNNSNSITYSVLSDIINNTDKQIDNLNRFLN